MSLILNIETSTTVCSAAIAKDGQVTSLRESREGLNHSALLGNYIDELLEEEGTDMHRLDAVAVSMGPGSYTGLRIGVSTAKGLCFGAGKPLIAVPTLQALALSVSSRMKEEDAWFCPMLDARRMEVYTAFFDSSNRRMGETRAEIITENSFADLLARRKIYFFGNGSGKIRKLLASPNACFIDGAETSARHIAGIAEQFFRERKFVDTAYFEPFYLKDFIATAPKKKIGQTNI